MLQRQVQPIQILTAMQQNLEYCDWNIFQGKLFGTQWAAVAEQAQTCSHLGVLLSAVIR